MMRSSLPLRIVHVAAAAVSASMLLGCASSGGTADGKPSLESLLAERGFKQGKEVSSIEDYRINGWSSVDSQHLIFDAGPSRNYLVTTQIPCNGLLSAEQIAFTSTVNQLSRFDKVLVQDAGFTTTCPIKELHALDKIAKPRKS